MSRRVGTDYFAVMKIPLIAGRVFTASDATDAPPVAIVNQAWVKRYAGGQDPIGQRLRLTFSPNEPFRQIVGVIGDVAEDNLASPPSPAMYFPLDQDSGFTIFLGYVIRSQTGPGGLGQFGAGHTARTGPATRHRGTAVDGADRQSVPSRVPATLSVLSDRQFRHAGPGSRHDRLVRLDFVLGRGAHARDRYSPGAGCTTRRHSAAHSSSRSDHHRSLGLASAWSRGWHRRE